MALAHKAALRPHALMESVLSVEGSQLYRQSAFNKKQVAYKEQHWATKDVSPSEIASVRRNAAAQWKTHFGLKSVKWPKMKWNLQFRGKKQLKNKKTNCSISLWGSVHQLHSTTPSRWASFWLLANNPYMLASFTTNCCKHIFIKWGRFKNIKYWKLKLFYLFVCQ